MLPFATYSNATSELYQATSTLFSVSKGAAILCFRALCRCDEAMLEAMFEMEERVAAAQVEAAQQVVVAADVLEIQAHEAQRALE